MDWLFGNDIARYQIELNDNGDADLQTYLRDILKDRLATLPEETDNEAEVKRRQRYREQSIRRDLVKALHAKGYYDANVQFHETISQASSGVYHIQTGTAYRISDIVYPQGDWDLYIQKLGIRPDDILDAQTVLQQQSALYREIDKDHCYFDLNVNHAVILNKENKSANLEYKIIAKEKAAFGTTFFSGQGSVETSYLNKLVPWRKGDCFRRSKIENLRTQLFESGLFSRVETTLPSSPDDNGLVDIKVNVKERAHRTVRLGLNYYTDTGPGLTAGWEHRNIFGQAEKLSADLTISTIEQNLKTSLSKPFFVRNDQTLNLSSSIKRQDTDAFEEIGLDIGGNIHRRFTRRLSGSVGGKYSLSRIKEDGRSTNTYGLLSLPGALTYDSRNNTLDPRKGWYLHGILSPYFDTHGESDPFIKMLLSGSTYIDLGKSPNMVLALRGQIGSIAGAASENIPATERFYAGGGGSVRGYGFQEVGPMRNGDPEGGRSIVTGSAELRYKLTEKIGMVTFVDVGSVTDTTTPDFHDPAIGAGLGARYYTDFGPIRFDIGVPLTQKKQTDDAFQIYISIGQAF
jgi:translocation and assembly module TamA